MAVASTSSVSGVRDDMNVCNLCGALENLSLCGGCRGTWYCCKAHQREDWRDHKQTCKKLNAKSTALTDSARYKHIPNSPDREKTPDSVLSESENICGESLKALPVFSDKNSDLEETKCEISKEDLNRDSRDSTLKTNEAENSRSVSDLDRARSNVNTNNSVFETSSAAVCKTKAKQARPKTKRKNKQDRVHLPTISEDGSTPERYYLNRSTHHINLPSSLKRQWLRQNSSDMGLEERHLSVKETKEQYLSILWARFQELACYVLECLTKYGICAIDKFLGEATGQEILKEVLQLKAAGIMRQGQLVHGPSSSRNKYIRGDMITWVDGSEPRSENIQYLISCMDAVVVQCASKLEEYTINERTKVNFPFESSFYVYYRF